MMKKTYMTPTCECSVLQLNENCLNTTSATNTTGDESDYARGDRFPDVWAEEEDNYE